MIAVQQRIARIVFTHRSFDEGTDLTHIQSVVHDRSQPFVDLRLEYDIIINASIPIEANGLVNSRASCSGVS